MLPRPAGGPIFGAARSTSIEERLADLRRQEASGAPPSERPSLRDSILKKPLSSLYNKD